MQCRPSNTATRASEQHLFIVGFDALLALRGVKSFGLDGEILDEDADFDGRLLECVLR
jgi:hypothetical protein